MNPSEARVFIIEDNAEKLERLTAFIEANGGQVVGSVDTREDADMLAGEGDFPADINDANIVLIDGNLDEHGRHGTDGMYVFLDSYKRGVMHRVDAHEGIGAVALACSIDNRAAVAYVTGGNFSDTHKDEAPVVWAKLLEPHPAEPVYLSEGTLERMDWSDGFEFSEMMNHVIKLKDNPNVTVLNLLVTETKKDGEEEIVTYSDEVAMAAEISTKNFVTMAGGWQGVEDGYITVDSHTVRALVQVGDYLYVISHSSRVCKDSWGSNLVNGGKTDRIAISGLAEIPDAYWENLGIERPAV